MFTVCGVDGGRSGGYNGDNDSPEVFSLLILYLFCALAAVCALAVVWAAAISWWWLIPIFLGAFVLWNGIYLLYVYIICKRVDMSKEYDDMDPFYHWNVNRFIEWLLAFCRVRPVLQGTEWLPEGRFLLVGNHRSAFDPLTAVAVFRKMGVPLTFISKPENIHKLFVGPAAWRDGFLPIDRENARNALKTINTAAQRMKDGTWSYGIYPEGTRTKDGNLQEFHPGSFKAAQKAHVPIVIMATEGSEKVLKNFPFRRTVVNLTILECIDADEVKAQKTAELAAHTKALLTEYLGH